jgi:uncharacterized protein YbjT (DUF2867 family)
MILLTGATGYVGSAMLPYLVRSGQPIRALIHKQSKAGRLPEGVEAVRGSVSDAASLDNAMQGVDTVVHLVAVNKNKGGLTMESINHQGTVNVVNAAKKAGVRQFVHMHGIGLKSGMKQEFANSKGLGADAVRASGIPYVMISPSVIFGQGDEFVNNLADLYKKWFYPFAIIPGSGQATFAPIWKEDVARVFASVVGDFDRYVGKEYEIGGAENLSLNQMMQLIKGKLGTRKPALHMPLLLVKPAVVVMNAVLPKPPVTPGLLDLLGIDNTPHPNAITTVFGIEPRRFAEGIDYIKR